MIYGLYPGTPIENAAAMMGAIEKHAFLYRYMAILGNCTSKLHLIT